MPIYAYRCGECGFTQDILQKISDAPRTVCPSCGKSEFKKQVTAAGFQLKGSGWYATDFKGAGANKAAPPATSEATQSDSTSSIKSDNTTNAADTVSSAAASSQI